MKPILIVWCTSFFSCYFEKKKKKKNFSFLLGTLDLPIICQEKVKIHVKNPNEEEVNKNFQIFHCFSIEKGILNFPPSLPSRSDRQKKSFVFHYVFHPHFSGLPSSKLLPNKVWKKIKNVNKKKDKGNIYQTQMREAHVHQESKWSSRETLH